MFDEATENAIWMFLEELMEAIRDERLTFFEGCEVIVAPVGAAPEYITVQVDDIYDENVLWRGIPPTLNVADIVVVWENPISHRREILGAGGAGGVGLLHDLLSATHGDTTAAAAVVGDLITGQAGPVWARLAIGTVDQLLTVNPGGTDPIWGSNLRQIQELEFDDAALLTIDVNGTITRTQVYHIVAANAGVADNLDQIDGGVQGDLLIIRPDAGDTITVRHDAGGAGDNIWLAAGVDIALDNDDHLMLIFDGTWWCDQSGGAGGGGGGTLDDAYDFGGAGAGRIIVADTGAIWIQDIGGLKVDSLLETSRTAAIAAQHTVVDGAGNAVTEVLRLIHNLNVGFGAVGMGTRALFQLVDDGGDIEDACAIDAIWEDAATASEDSYLAFLVRVAGAALAEICYIENTGITLANAKVIKCVGNADAVELDLDGDTSIGAPTDDQIDFEVGGADKGILVPGGWEGDTFAFVVKNTSGGAVSAGAPGYIDSAGEFKTTTTAYLDAAWCVVLGGGANNADIYVARRGRVTVTLNGNCSAGDFLFTSTTAGQAQPQSYMRPEVFAVALTANGVGAGGTCSALLLCETTFRPVTSSIDIISVNPSATTSWRTTINGAPAGAVVTYTSPLSSGAENCIVPIADNQLGKFRLYNETRGTYGLIDRVNTVAKTITLTAAAPVAWANLDVITVRSQTCTNPAAPPYFFDVDLSDADNIVIPKVARTILIEPATRDTTTPGYLYIHPWETYATSKAHVVPHYVANITTRGTITVSLIQQRFCILISASGAATAYQYHRLAGVWEATP